MVLDATNQLRHGLLSGKASARLTDIANLAVCASHRGPSSARDWQVAKEDAGNDRRPTRFQSRLSWLVLSPSLPSKPILVRNRTQEVGGSSPPGSINKTLLARAFGKRSPP